MSSDTSSAAQSTDVGAAGGESAAVSATGDAPLVRVRNLKKYFDTGSSLLDRLFGDPSEPVRAVDGVSFDVHRGETLGLVGESGCGKSTAGETILRLQDPTDGTVEYDGEDLSEQDDLFSFRRRASIVFQDPFSSLDPRMTVGATIRQPMEVHDWPLPESDVEGRESRSSKALRRERAAELIERVGLSADQLDRYPNEFSGGQRQRIGIARALALNPEFVVLDEPTSALDVSVQAQILNLLEDLQAEFGLTYLLISHDLSVIRHICDRVAVMYLGHIMEIGDTEELFEQPKNPYTYSLLSAIPSTDPTATRERVTLRGTPPSPRFPPEGCPFATRCPVKIRPDEYETLDDDVWEGIEVLRGILRERERADKTLTETTRELLGLETRFAGYDDILVEIFGEGNPATPTTEGTPDDRSGLEMLETLPESVRPTVTEAVEAAMDGDEARAQEILAAEFSSVCDSEKPAHNPVSESGRTSFCHRHLDEYEEPEPVFDRVLGRTTGADAGSGAGAANADD